MSKISYNLGLNSQHGHKQNIGLKLQALVSWSEISPASDQNIPHKPHY